MINDSHKSKVPRIYARRGSFAEQESKVEELG